MAKHKKNKGNGKLELDRDDAKELKEWQEKPKHGFNTPFANLKQVLNEQKFR